MLAANDNNIAQQLIAKGTPDYRKAYSDRIAWLMAYMSQLAYLRFDPPTIPQKTALEIARRALKRGRTQRRIMEVLAKSYGYNHQAKKKALEKSLHQVGWTLVETISVESTQAFVAVNGKSGQAVLAFRGTEADRIGDIRADVKARHAICPTGGRVHEGFHTHYNDAESEILRVLDDNRVKGKPLFITGHSLGGAVATIATRRLTEDHRIAACYTFGSPRVGTEGMGLANQEPGLPNSQFGRPCTVDTI